MKLKKGDKVYFTKESAPNFQETYLTYGKKYEVLDVKVGNGILFYFISDSGLKNASNVLSKCHLNGGTWLKVKTKKRKLEKEIENLQRKLETTEQLLKVSRERIAEIEKDFKAEMLAIAYTSLQKLGVVNWSIETESDMSGSIQKHTFELTINN